MKKIGFLLTAIMVLVGCQAPNSTLVYTCDIDQSINQISHDRNGSFTFPTAAPIAKVFFFNDVINIRDFVIGEYAGFPLNKSKEHRRVESIKDFNVMINKGDYYHDDGHIIEIVSPKNNTISLFLIDSQTGKTNSLQFLTDCKKEYVVLKPRGHNHEHDDKKEHPLLKRSD
ncbi:hypothetical protein [Providencia vermicola]|uniref:hypothetical protein n=1 Tax=Providencia vermicola TaxID=333965 RepID=UPI0022076AFA|nr:hypothetical protein NFC79_06825 [Providencia stuartii]